MSEQTMVERVAAAVEQELSIVEMVLASPQQIKALQAKRIARAAIAAMREPNKAVQAAGWATGVWRDAPGDLCLEAWQAMIDAALSEVEA